MVMQMQMLLVLRPSSRIVNNQCKRSCSWMRQVRNSLMHLVSAKSPSSSRVSYPKRNAMSGPCSNAHADVGAGADADADAVVYAHAHTHLFPVCKPLPKLRPRISLLPNYSEVSTANQHPHHRPEYPRSSSPSSLSYPPPSRPPLHPQ